MKNKDMGILQELFLTKSNNKWVDLLIREYHYSSFKNLEELKEKEKDLYELDKASLEYFIARMESVEVLYDYSKVLPFMIMFITVFMSILVAAKDVFISINLSMVIIIYTFIILFAFLGYTIILPVKERLIKLVYLKTRFQQILDEK
ncbi:hypothetical protein [Bacillus toyonensis]|uniref:hypothetical protein n=2 Tax=Bacillus toyonensis TaxID=155322 RepID=UPI0030195C3D